MRRLLLISNSTLYGSEYLDHAADQIRDFLGAATRIAFVPFALHDRNRYASQARERFRAFGCTLVSLHDVSNPRRALADANVVFIGGGNTFRLLKWLYDWDLLDAIRERVNGGMPYIGSSAGSIVACPTLKTTKDMPIVQPPSFEALGLVSFQISPHYLDPDPASTHMGETQEERILQFLEENESPVAGLREGAMLCVENDAVTLRGSAGARIFRRGEPPAEMSPGTDLTGLLHYPVGAEA
ncbi:MAG TPA: dipeptidase PepE [Terriglobales bacterium]|jgi:dipeptidase E|nr:dipeptidase PepE [Terriglobales bacterium]